MKKTLVIVVCLVMILCMTSCGKPQAKYTIGICQLTQHNALDKATEGFIAAVKEDLGDDVAFESKNASGEAANCTTIINGFVSKRVDLIMANATPALQAAAAATSEIPILGTSVTHYAPALDISISDWIGTVGGNISGTSDLADLEKQAQMIPEWFPNAKKVAILYCSAEANSIFQVEEIIPHLQNLGLEAKAFAFTDTNDVAAVAGAACSFGDVIYIPTDNTAAANTEAIANIVYENHVPVIAGELDTCKGCGVATMSIDYYDLGYTTGKMAVKILRDGADISKMPIEYAPQVTYYYNQSACDMFEMVPLAGYTKIE